MTLLERVTTLIRANLNDLIDKAEDPEKMLKQVIVDMENQLVQVKTQVAVAIADEHMLEKKRQENEDKKAEWMRKAELAVQKDKDDLARQALERYKSYEQLAKNFAEQVEDQRMQAENLKSALQKLDQKLAEANSKKDMLVAKHRRARMLTKATQAQMAIGEESHGAAFDRLNDQVIRAEAVSQAHAELVHDDVNDQFDKLEKEDEINKLLEEIKQRRSLNP
jgi:phage shock protein A